MPESKIIKGCKFRLLKCDFTDTEVEAIVYYAQSSLKLGAGFGNAISVRGGPSIQKELDQLGEKKVCDVVITGAGNLKSQKILHAVGPKFQERDTDVKLVETLQNALRLASENGIKQLAIPPLGAGFYGVPLDNCARIMVKTITDYLVTSNSLEDVVICAMDNREYRAFKTEFDKIVS